VRLKEKPRQMTEPYQYEATGELFSVAGFVTNPITHVGFRLAPTQMAGYSLRVRCR